MEFRKARKIRIGGRQFAAVLNRQSREMAIRSKIGRSVSRAKHPLKDRPVVFGGSNQAGAGLIEPALHPVDGL